jgi:1,4-dihydroxy-6-naphthoate synthase
VTQVRPLSLGYSPCPNDTFIFSAWVNGLLDGAPPVDVQYEDISVLNGLARESALDVIKVSFHVFGHLREDYCLLRSGGALGRGCGPLVVAREPWQGADLAGKRIAIPGERTTAALLLRLFAPGVSDTPVMPFDEIMAATREGVVDAGLIIHESRFTYPDYGLHEVVDLGEWWEGHTGHPVPLGGIVARRSLGAERIRVIEETLRASLAFAYARPTDIWDTVREHAQEMDDDVMRRHIDLYVNEYSHDYGEAGEAAIRHLIAAAEDIDLVPRVDTPLFVTS